MNAFEEMALNLADYERELVSGSAPAGTSVASLTFPTLLNQNQPLVVPCTHTKVDRDYVLQEELGGWSQVTAIERAEWRAGLVPAVMQSYLRKGLKANLCLAEGQPPLKMQLWVGGLLEGATVYRFMLVDAGYGA